MKLKKVKFTIIGLVILSAAACGWILTKTGLGDAVWIAWMAHILGLVTVFTIGNSKDKQARINEEKKV